MRNSYGSKSKYIILIVVILLILLAVGVFMLMNKENNEHNTLDNNNVVEEVKPVDLSDEDNVYYYICDEDETTLSVRNKESGDRIDRLACGSKVVLLEESTNKTDICDKWYYVEYTKYTSNVPSTTKGYVCGTYLSTRSDDVRNVFTELDLSLVRNDARYIRINNDYNITIKRDDTTMDLYINDYSAISNKVSCMGTITLVGDYLVVSNNDGCGDDKDISIYDTKGRVVDSIKITDTSDNILDLTYIVKGKKIYYKLINNKDTNYKDTLTVGSYTIKYCSSGNYEEGSYPELNLDYEIGRLYQVSISDNRFTTTSDYTSYTLKDYIEEIGSKNICISK